MKRLLTVRYRREDGPEHGSGGLPASGGGGPTLVAASVAQPEPPKEHPQSFHQAAWELGVTQEAIAKLREEVAEVKAQGHQSGAAVGDLAKIMASLESDLKHLREREVIQTEAVEKEQRAPWWARMLGG